ncbi:MAG TPA: NFACT family protein [Candidatus Norongarragalinales archaeon]|nr:NFACT family protein [Candidatus Norongarragalinales archaeon]
MKLSKTIVSLSNLDLHYLVREMKSLEGQYVQKVYGEGRTFRLRFKNADVVTRVPEKIYLADKPPTFSEHPDSYVMLLRKHIAGKLVRVEQLNFDRILRFTFEKASLVFELFAKGNVILLNADSRIIKPLENEKYASRVIHAGQDYVAPPMIKKHPSNLALSDFSGLKGKVVSVLSKVTNFSPFYLEEACARCGVDTQTMMETLTEAQRTNLMEALKKMLDDYAPHRYGGVVSPIKLYRLPEGQSAPSFSELLEKQPVLVEEEKDNKEYLQATQRKAIEDFGQKENLATRKAQWLSNHLDALKALLEGNDDPTERMGAKVTRKGNGIEIDVPDIDVADEPSV